MSNIKTYSGYGGLDIAALVYALNSTHRVLGQVTGCNKGESLVYKELHWLFLTFSGTNRVYDNFKCL